MVEAAAKVWVSYFSYFDVIIKFSPFSKGTYITYTILLCKPQDAVIFKDNSA